MFDILRRFGFGVSRGLAMVIVLVTLGLFAALWIGPLQATPGELQLLVLGEDGRFGESVELRLPPADTTAGRADRYPLLFGVRNLGARTVEPLVLSLSIPARFRLLDRAGTPYAVERSPNNPLVRYRLRLPPVSFPPDSQPVLLAAIDTLWIEPVLHAYECVLTADRVPEFVPTPAYDPEELARIEAFYSFIGGSEGVRQAGLLELGVDPDRLRIPAAPAPPNTRPAVTEPAAEMPDVGALGYLGERRAECGDPMQPIELHTIAWGTANGGTFLVLYHGGSPRKYLFDLNGDDIAEIEMWDPDGDGDFEARRPTRLPIPDYLFPLDPEAEVAVDTLPTDALWLENFHDVADGPFRFLPDSLRPDRPVPVDTTPPPAAAAPPVRRDTAPPVRRDTTPPVRRDTAPAVRRDTVERRGQGQGQV
jgi:hypothetical protein